MDRWSRALMAVGLKCSDARCAFKVPAPLPARRAAWQDARVAITGVHALLYTTEPEALRAVLRDVFGWPFVDTGGGWLIFGLPPAELGVHPAEGPTYASGVRHQLSLMCDDLGTTVDELRGKGIEVRGEPQDEGWGITTTLILPGGVEVMLYEPRHPKAI